MAKAAQPAPAAAAPEVEYYRLKVKRPFRAAGTQFNPGVVYRVKKAVLDQIKDVAVDPQPIIKGK